MKFILPFNEWPGGFLKSLNNSLIELGHEVYNVRKYKLALYSRVFYRLDYFGYFGINKVIQKKRQFEYNKLLIESCKLFKPDFFINVSGSGYLPSTINILQNEMKVRTICYVADNPCDPIRDKYFAMSLKYYNILLYADKIWLKILDKLAPDSIKIKFLGGYDPTLFFPEDVSKLSNDEFLHLKHDLVFTGGSYDETAEGAYRAGILGQLANSGYNVKIWGDKGWNFRKQFYPGLSDCINNQRLPYRELRMLFQLSKIYVNMPSPQIFTSFQPRVFEIAASKGFQIIDYSDELESIFCDDYVSFKTFNELKEKIDYYLNKPDERNKIIENMYKKVKNEYTWTNQICKILNQLPN